MRRGFQRLVVCGLALTLGVMSASPALARGGERGHGDHDRHGSQYSDRGERDHGRYARRGGRGRGHDRYRHRGHHRGRRDFYRGVPRYYHDRGDSSYYCAACRHPFSSRGHFDEHLTSHHRIAPWQIPFVVAHAIVGGVFGWVFYGS